ncbi:MAG: toll/interleukin-1 receptor domain-containing protein [Lewinellaceae bacterium]|nr:toll/interleukin-1 receptor domain-containing protein [Lewinellaceae bacterium]
MTAGPVEKQIDRAIRLNQMVLLVLSEHSVKSDWVEYEVSKARELEKNLNHHVICPIALVDSWKDAPWPNVMMNQVKKYNILDLSKWEDNGTFQAQLQYNEKLSYTLKIKPKSRLHIILKKR